MLAQWKRQISAVVGSSTVKLSPSNISGLEPEFVPLLNRGTNSVAGRRSLYGAAALASTILALLFAALAAPASAAQPIPNLAPPMDCRWQTGATQSGGLSCAEKPDPDFGRAIVQTKTEWIMGACSGGEVDAAKRAARRIIATGKPLRLTWSVFSACLMIADNVEAANGKVCVDGPVVGMLHPVSNPAERQANYYRAQPTVEQFISGNYDKAWFHRFSDPSYEKRDIERTLPLFKLAYLRQQVLTGMPRPGHFSPAFRERYFYPAEMTAIFGRCGG